MKKQDGKQTGRANYVWTLAGVYLIYLGGKLLLGVVNGEAEGIPLWVAISAGILFLAVGGWLLLREWRAYRYAAEHKDDPSTWSDEAAEEAAGEAVEEAPLEDDAGGEDGE